MAKGYTQTYGVDYQETFSPVAKLSIVKVLLSLTANLDRPLHQFDVKKCLSTWRSWRRSVHRTSSGIHNIYWNQGCVQTTTSTLWIETITSSVIWAVQSSNEEIQIQAKQLGPYTIHKAQSGKSNCVDSLCGWHDYHRKWWRRNNQTSKGVSHRIWDEELGRTQVFSGNWSCQVQIRNISFPKEVCVGYINWGRNVRVQTGGYSNCPKP